MKTTRLHTFEGILKDGIYADGADEPIKIQWIFIPKIQRSYAQGRICESDVRSDFLKEIFSTLLSDTDKPLELSFLLGSRQPLVNSGESGFELLDGQQRATTLFLLYWYVCQREADKMPEYLGRFTYETRDTSSQFLKKIAETKFDLSSMKPSDAIRANKWFTDDFECDATVCAMLNMLDDIHKEYKKSQRKDLLGRLSRLQFYVLLLDKFDMNDELYIKMNSRGLSLTPFENFKASIVRYMKSPDRKGVYGSDDSNCGEAPFWLKFTSDIDAKWIDIFWQNPFSSASSDVVNTIIDIDDSDIGNRYFRFFNRYFFTKAVIMTEVKKNKLHALPSFFYNDTESEVTSHRLKGWEYYEELFGLIANARNAGKYPVFGPIERILDVFHDHYAEIRNMICEARYGGTSGFDVLDRDNYLLSHRAVFAAVTEFIEVLGEKDFSECSVQENFRKMLRVVHNIIENTPMENTVTLAGVINAVSEIIHLPGAADCDFYRSLANAALKSKNRQLQEEQIKAKEMFDKDGNYDPSWEKAFITAESHPFFKGSVLFFFTPGSGTSTDFEKRFNIVKDLFDENGITLQYREDRHILIRAMLSCLDQWDTSGMRDRYITENAEKEKYLKNILTGSAKVRTMFCQYFENQELYGSMECYLKDVVKKAALNLSTMSGSFKMLYSRLVTDDNSTYIFDWIGKREMEQKSCFRIQDNRSYIIAIPGTWYDRIVLDTERHLIIPDLINNGFEYSDNNQKDAMNGPMKDSWGWQIRIKKSIETNTGTYELELNFNEYKFVEFSVYGKDIRHIVATLNVTQDKIVPDGVKLASVGYQFYKDRKPIFDKVREIETLIGTL